MSCKRCKTVIPELLEVSKLVLEFFGNSRWYQDSGTKKERLCQLAAAIVKTEGKE